MLDIILASPQVITLRVKELVYIIFILRRYNSFIFYFEHNIINTVLYQTIPRHTKYVFIYLYTLDIRGI